MKIFISQPMRGLRKAEILMRRADMITKIQNFFSKDAVFIESFIEEEPGNEACHPDIWCLGESIKRLSEADYIFMAKGWRNARGCAIEHGIAVTYGLGVIYDEFEEIVTPGKEKNYRLRHTDPSSLMSVSEVFDKFLKEDLEWQVHGC